MYKEEYERSGVDFYSGLQTIFPDEKALTLTERMKAARGPLLSWYRANKRDLPWRNKRDGYSIWISEIMLQQTRVEAVKPYYARFMEQFPNVYDLADCNEEELFKCWEGLGYYSRARNLKKAAQIIVSEHGGKLPANEKKLLALPGIGSYTAGAIASLVYGIPAPAVDGNVMRVLSRVAGSFEDVLKQAVKKKTENSVRAVLEQLKPDEIGDFNQALIETGAVVCIPNGKPVCGLPCPFRSVCQANKLGLTETIPVKTPKKERAVQERTILLLEYQNRIAIQRRPDRGLLASLYEFPGFDGRHSTEEILKQTGAKAKSVEPLPDTKHIFSHVEWHMSGYLIRLTEELPGFLFVEKKQLENQYPIPNAFAAYKKFLLERESNEKNVIPL